MKTESIVRNSLVIGFGTIGLSACGGGGGGGTTPPPLAAPSNLSYSIASARLLPLVDAPVNVPTVQGQVTSWAIHPALPAGLGLDPATGEIAGRPVSTRPVVTYTIQASNAAGSTSSEVDIGVNRPAHFVYVANQDDDTISMYVADAHTGALTFHGYIRQAEGERAPTSLQVRPDRRFLYVANEGDGITPSTVSVYAISNTDGRLTRKAPTLVGAGVRDLAISASGQRLYVASYDSDLLYPMNVESANGSLSPAGVPLATGDGPAALALSPAGDRLWIVNRLGGTVSTFSIDPTSGALTKTVADKFVDGVPCDITTDVTGSQVFVTVEDTGRILAFDVNASTGALTKRSDEATGVKPGKVAIHPAERFAYVVHSDSTSISIFAVQPDTGKLTPNGSAEVGAPAADIVFDASGLYAYVIEQGTNEIWIYSVDQGNGTLTQTSRIRSRSGPTSIAMVTGSAPLLQQGRCLYAVNNESGDLTSYQIGSAGALTEVGTPALAGSDPRDTAVDPLNRYLVTVDAGTNFLTIYSIDPSSGAIGELWPAVALAGRSRGVAVDPTGRFVYVAVRAGNRVQSFEVDVAGHTLQPISNVHSGSNPYTIAIDPTGQFLYVTNAVSDDIYAFVVREGVILEPPAIIDAPGNPLEVSFSPSGEFAIVPLETGDHLATFAVNPRTGVLETVLPGRASNNKPVAVGVHRSGRFAYAAVNGGIADAGHLSSFAFDSETARLTNEVEHTESIHPRDLALDPSGRFVFTADEATASLSCFVVNPVTGNLQHLGTVPSGLSPRAMAMTTSLTIEIEP